MIFYEEDLRECGIDVTEASVYSGLCTQIFREEFGLYQGKVFCFVHLSVQEHLAALYVHLSFTNSSTNVIVMGDAKESDINVLLKCAADKTLESKNGHLDLFLRFLWTFNGVKSGSPTKVFDEKKTFPQDQWKLLCILRKRYKHVVQNKCSSVPLSKWT